MSDRTGIFQHAIFNVPNYHEGYCVDDNARAFEWFLGRNDLGVPLYDFASGGCGDGLHIDRVNANQGAESTLAFHLALSGMYDAEHEAIISKNGESLVPKHYEKDQPAPTSH